MKSNLAICGHAGISASSLRHEMTSESEEMCGLNASKLALSEETPSAQWRKKPEAIQYRSKWLKWYSTKYGGVAGWLNEMHGYSEELNTQAYLGSCEKGVVSSANSF